MTAPRKSGKTGSRNPANKPTDVATWKKSAQPPLLLMPSGNYMRIKKIGLRALMASGAMPNSLMAYAEKAVKKGKKETVSDADMVAILQDEKKLKEITQFMDRVIIICADEPQVHEVPDEGVERDDNLLYVDEVQEEDKMFVFQVVTGGTTDVEQFRAEHTGNVASVYRRKDLELPAK